MNTYPSEGYQSHHSCRSIGNNGNDLPLCSSGRFLPRNHEVLYAEPFERKVDLLSHSHQKVSAPSQTSIRTKEIMSGMPHPQSPSFNPVNTTGSQPFGAAPPPTELNFLAGMTDATMEDTTMTIPRNMDLRARRPVAVPDEGS